MARLGPQRHKENKFSKIKYPAVCLIGSAQKGQTTATVINLPLYKSMFVTIYIYIYIYIHTHTYNFNLQGVIYT